MRATLSTKTLIQFEATHLSSCHGNEQLTKDSGSNKVVWSVLLGLRAARLQHLTGVPLTCGRHTQPRAGTRKAIACREQCKDCSL